MLIVRERWRKLPGWARFVLSFGILLVACAAWLQVGIQSSVIPARGEICQQNEETKEKECSVQHISLVALWQVAKFVKDFEGAITALSTVVLAVFTWRLWWSTDNLWQEAVEAGKTAKIAADAAKKSADAATAQIKSVIATERAYVKLSHVGIGIVALNDYSAHANLRVKNWGKTPAVVTSVRFDGKVLTHQERLPIDFPYRAAAPTDIASAYLVPDEFYDVELVVPLSGDEADNLRYSRKVLWVFGHVDYMDVVGKGQHRSGWVRTFVPRFEGEERDNLVYAVGDRYNYDRPRNPGEGNDWPSTT